MIPKIIHFFHNEDFVENMAAYGKMVNRCYATWKHYLPDYQLKLWHDKMPEFQKMLASSAYLRDVYEKKIWAVVADYVRAWAVLHYGGVYLDTDVYLFQNIDRLLKSDFFTFSMPVDEDNELAWHVEPAFFGAVANHPVMAHVLDIYDSGEIYKMPVWLANDIFAMAILRTKADFSDNLIRPANQEQYESGQRGDFLSQELIEARVCHLPSVGITLYPRHMLGEGGAVGQWKNRWFLITPPPLPRKMMHNPDVFSMQDVIAYHICGNSWKAAVPYMETKNLHGLARLKALCISACKNIAARIKQIARTKIKNM